MPWGARGLVMGFMVLSLVRPAAALAVAAAVIPVVAWWGRTWAGQVLWAELIVVAFALPYALRMSLERARAHRSRVHWPAFGFAAIVVTAILVDFSVIHLRLGPDAARFIGEHLWQRYFTDDLQSAVHAGLLLLEGLLLLVAAERIASSQPAWKRRLAAAVVIGAAAAGVLNVYRLVISAQRTDGFWKRLAEYLATIRLNEAFQDANAAGSLFIAALFLAMGLACFSGYISMRDTIMKTGVKLYEYQGPYSIHAKSVIYDQRLSAVGSFNLDSRSTFLNNESMVIIDSQEFAKKLTMAMENKMDKSILIANHKRWIKSPDTQKKEEPVMKRTFLYALAKVTRFFKEFI